MVFVTHLVTSCNLVHPISPCRFGFPYESNPCEVFVDGRISVNNFVQTETMERCVPFYFDAVAASPLYIWFHWGICPCLLLMKLYQYSVSQRIELRQKVSIVDLIIVIITITLNEHCTEIKL